jgi:hypothetical protein
MSFADCTAGALRMEIRALREQEAQASQEERLLLIIERQALEHELSECDTCDSPS